MNKLDYWIEAVEAALEDIGKLNNYTNEELKTVAESLIISSEQESMAFGYDCIPNPLESTIRDMKSKHESEIKQYEKRESVYRQNVADRHGPRVGPNQVYIDGNNVMYDLR